MALHKARQHDRQVFAKKVLACNGDPKKAMVELSPELSIEAVGVKTCRWMSDPKVIKQLSAEFEALNLTSKDIKNYLSTKLLRVIEKDNTKDADVIAGSMATAKLHGIINDNGAVNIALLGADHISDILARHKKSTVEHIEDV